MAFVQNFPLFSILLTLIASVLTSVLRRRTAGIVTLLVMLCNLVLNAAALMYTLRTGESYVYFMGHFPAPWGNEIRVGTVETLSMTVFMLVILFSWLGGRRWSLNELEPSKYNLFCIMVDLSTLALLALVYTNDIFTGYVFIEISTLAAAGLVMMRQNGHSLVAGARYMIMNLLGSSLFLLGTVILYTITGHLLMTPIHEQVALLAADGNYRIPLDVTVALISVGLGMKSAMYPFEKWLPGAYSNATPTASALLSSIVSKGYIFLLIKVYVRVIGLDVIKSLGIADVLFAFGAAGMIMGSVNAIRAKTVRMMVAYSSVAQIGYIFLAVGMGTAAGMQTAAWHVLAHSAAKAMLFIAGARLCEASDGSQLRADMKGAFYRAPLAAFAFSLGALNMVGLPLMSMFVTKVSLGQAAVAAGGRHMFIALICLAVSTLLNLDYFMRTAVSLYVRDERKFSKAAEAGLGEFLGLIGFIILNLLLGFLAGPLFELLGQGIASFV